MVSLPLSDTGSFPHKSRLEDGRFRESHGISGEVLQHQVRDLREHVRPPHPKVALERLAEFRTGSLVRPIHLFVDCFLFFPFLVSKMTNVRVILRQAKDVTNSSSNDVVWPRENLLVDFGQVCGFPSPLHSTTSRDSGHLRTFSIGSQESGARAWWHVPLFFKTYGRNDDLQYEIEWSILDWTYRFELNHVQ